VREKGKKRRRKLGGRLSKGVKGRTPLGHGVVTTCKTEKGGEEWGKIASLENRRYCGEIHPREILSSIERGPRKSQWTRS